MNQLQLLAVCAGGMAAFASTGHAQVTNGNFGTGDFTGWTASGPADPTFTSVTNTAPTADSTYAASIGAYYDGSSVIFGSVSQVLTTVPGQQYVISFLYGEQNVNQSYGGPGSTSFYLDSANRTNSTDPNSNVWAQANNLTVTWGGTPVFSASNFFTSDQPASATDPDGGLTIGDYFYQVGSFSIVATSASTVLNFSAQDYQQAAIVTDITVPEPATLTLLGTAFAGMGWVSRRRRRNTSAVA